MGTTRQPAAGENAAPAERTVPVPFADALGQVIKNLRNQPLLLFVLGVGLLMLSAAAIGMNEMRLLTVPLLIVFVLGAVGWIFLEARKMQRNKSRITSGSIRAGKTARIEDVDAETGAARAEEMISGTETDVRSGDVEIRGTVERSRLKTGSVSVGRTKKTDEDN